MLYSALVSIATYYIVWFVLGILTNALAFEGQFITLAVIGFIGAYYVRNYSRFVYRMAMVVGVFATICLVAIWGILPMLANSTNKWLIILAVIAGLVMYFATRLRIYQHYTRRTPAGTLTAPPFGKEWCRWLFIIMM